MTVKVLPPDVANRIAAGEVVERPASVVKELVENALDAGARHLTVEVEEGGLKLIRVVDDGCGMSEADLTTCILPHATSKIQDVEDLFRVSTFGFRGEALPSIGSVSRLEITTRREGEPLGRRLVVEEGRVEGPHPFGAPLGTTVTVTRIFHNVPARRRFLKSERAETAAVSELLTRMALPDPGFAMELRSNGKSLLSVPACASRRDRVRSLLGAGEGDRLLEVEGTRGSARVHALISPPDLVRPTSRSQYLFVNGRWIRDRKLSVAISEAWRGLIMPKDHPLAFVFLSVDPAEVDVNVHPTKSEVRFRDADGLFSLIVRTFRERLDRGPTAHRLDFPKTVPLSSVTPHVVLPAAPTRAPAPLPRIPDYDPGPMPWDPPAPVGGGLLFAAEAPVRALQMHDAYIVVETLEGIRILDQHALHERMLFDQLLERFEGAGVAEQPLLIPAVMEVGAEDAARLLDHREDLAAAGLTVDPFGHAAVALRSVPLPLSKLAPASVLELVLAILREDRRASRGELVRDVLAHLACRAAVKFGDRLPLDQIEALVRHERSHPEARNCPHGRNVALLVGLSDLEIRFQRKK